MELPSRNDLDGRCRTARGHTAPGRILTEYSLLRGESTGQLGKVIDANVKGPGDVIAIIAMGSCLTPYNLPDQPSNLV